MEHAHAVNATQIKSLVERSMLRGLVPIIYSSPGMGKSDIIKQIAKKHKLFVIDFRLAECDAVDINGFPYFKGDGKAAFAPMDVFPLKGEPIPEGYDGFLFFFDELPQGTKDVQKAIMKPVLDRMIGQRKLHEKCYMVAAGNRMTDKAGVTALLTPLKSRLQHLHLKLDLKSWLRWAANNKIDHRIQTFIEHRPDLLSDFRPSVNEDTFACPRTYEFASDYIKGDTFTADLLPAIVGTIGPGPASELYAYCQLEKDLPSITQIEELPEITEVPDEAGTRFLLTGMLASQTTGENVQAFITYIERMTPEFTIVYLRMAYKNNTQLLRNPVFNKKLRTFKQELKDYV